jgi:hypothetical protein
MKNQYPIFWLIAVAVVVLGIAGISFFVNATTPAVGEWAGAQTRALVAGITCLVLATGLLCLGAFMFRKHD